MKDSSNWDGVETLRQWYWLSQIKKQMKRTLNRVLLIEYYLIQLEVLFEVENQKIKYN